MTVLDTGRDAMTVGRFLAACRHLNETFCLTHGDGLSNVDPRAQSMDSLRDKQFWGRHVRNGTGCGPTAR